MKKYIFLFLISFSVDTVENTPCNSNEEIIFSCRSHDKTISICASNEKQYIHYLFSNKNNLELDAPNKNHQNSKDFFRVFYAYGPGLQSYMTFKQGKFNYYIYSDYGDDSFSETGLKMSSAFDANGVVVLKDSRVVTHLKCSTVNTRLSEQSLKSLKLKSDDDIKHQQIYFDARVDLK